MAVVAPISKWERRRPLVLALICLFFAAWFAYDGWYGWPAADDAAYKKMQQPGAVDAAARKIALTWPGWHHTSKKQIMRFDSLANQENMSGYHSITDILNQRWIVLAIGAVGLAGLLWYGRIRNRQLQADDQGLALSDGRLIPWNNITVIDNVYWQDKGIVRISYLDSAGQTQKINIDGTLFEDLPPLLHAIAERAIHAQMISPPIPNGPSTSESQI